MSARGGYAVSRLTAERLEMLRAQRGAITEEIAHELWAEIDALRGLVGDYQAYSDSLTARVRELEDALGEYRDALIWCSGSDDFNVGGRARKGWLKVCAPLIGTEGMLLQGIVAPIDDGQSWGVAGEEDDGP